MTRNNSWWNFPYGSNQHNNNDNSKIKKIKKTKKITSTSESQEDSHNRISSEHDRSNSMTSETSTDISDSASTAATLVETLDNNNALNSVTSVPSVTSDAIPIPKNPDGQVESHEEQKNRYSSSFRSWWSSSTSSLTSHNQKDSIIHNNNSMDENQKTTNSTSNSTKLSRHDKQILRHDNGSSVSVLTPINEDASQSMSSDSREGELKKSRPSSSATSLNKLGVESNVEMVDNKNSKTLDSKLSSSHSSNSSTVSSRTWWMFGGGNHTAPRDDINSTNVSESVPKQAQMTEVNDTINKQADQSSSKDQNTSNHISSSSSDSGIPSSNECNRRKVTKKSSSEIRRWTIFGTWSSSSLNLLESTNEGENNNGKTVGDEATSKSHSGTKSDSSNDTVKNVNSSENGSTKGVSQNNESSHDSKLDKKPKSHKRPTNPITENLSENSSSWVHFFTNVSKVQSKNSKIEATNRKMITDGSAKDSLKVSTTVEVEKKTTVDTPTVSASPTLKPVPDSVVLPNFEEFLRNKPRRCPNSMMQQALHAINSYFFPPDKSPEGTLPKWLDEITRSTVDVKRIAIIGVHGWFPAKLLRAVVGEPTGTSPKFCDMMAKSILGYLSQHGIILPSNAITCIPLVGEGTISTREELLHRSLLHNKTWCEALSLADVVFVATHSQGTPVSTILLSRLIKEGLIHPKRQRICMLAMAGISHGPFPYLKESYIVKYYVGAGRSHDADAARELFEFMDSESLVSKKYREALNAVIHNGVKIVYVASMDDQVVPLYSGLFTGVNHPSIMRAVYIDGPLYQTNDFLTNLIVFAIRLRNAGINDHGLMVQLSKVVAGSMYGEGHSALYTEIDVYTLAVRYLFETPSLGTFDLGLDRFIAQQKHNPYYLPWAMRGILEDKGVWEARHFVHEISKLRKQYEDWEPVSKTMKDVKYQLEPLRDAILNVRSKL